MGAAGKVAIAAVALGVGLAAWVLGTEPGRSLVSSPDPAKYREDYLGRLSDQPLLGRYVAAEIRVLKARDRYLATIQVGGEPTDGTVIALEALRHAEEERSALWPSLATNATSSGLDPEWVMIRAELRAKRIHHAAREAGK